MQIGILIACRNWEIMVVSQEKYEHSQYDSWTIYYDRR